MRLELSQLSKRFGESQALREVTLAIEDFHSLAIIGPSGGGKTTLLRILAGLTAPDAGRGASTDRRWTSPRRRCSGTGAASARCSRPTTCSRT